MCSNQDDKITFNSPEEFIGREVNHKKISQRQRDVIDRELTMKELDDALSTAKSKSSPGSTGFSYAFYKAFWNELKYHIFECYKEISINKKLPDFLSRGIITLLPKGDKDRTKITNWRPVTLLDVLYKLLSKMIAKRINEVLPNILSADQAGFVKGRYIGECIRSTMDTLSWAKRNNKQGLLLLIDFKKAFDSISFKFIKNSMRFFGFGEGITEWVGILLNGFKAVINNGGNISREFDVARGCRQGDPVSSLLFILAIEIMCICIRSAKNIKGFKIENFRALLSLYADDCSIFLSNEEGELRNVIKILDDFYRTSGLEIHLGKTQVVRFGKDPMSMKKLCPDLGLQWEQEFKLLGVYFNATTLNYDVNFKMKVDEIIKVAKSWQYRLLTPIGRAVIAKTLMLSKINHLIFVLPNITKKRQQEIEALIFEFIWGGKGKDKVNRNDAKQDFKKGGLNFPDIEGSWKAFKFSWLRRLWEGDGLWVKLFAEEMRPLSIIKNVRTFLCNFNMYSLNKNLHRIKNTFWRSVLSIVDPIWRNYQRKYPQTVGNCNVWGSTHIVSYSGPIEADECPNLSAKAKYVRDFLINENGNSRLMNPEEIIEKYDGIPREEAVQALEHLNTAATRQKIEFDKLDLQMPMRPGFVSLLNISRKGCAKWTSLLKSVYGTTNSIVKFERKWARALGRPLSIQFWDQSYKNASLIFWNNKLKMFHFNIVRGILMMNNRAGNHLKLYCSFAV